MKKIFALVALVGSLMMAGQANAQLSVNAGFANQMKTYTGTVPVFGGYTDRDTSMSGFFVGASYNLPIAGALSVAPGIYYQRLGHNTSSSLAVTTAHFKSVEQAIAIPILFNYSFEMSRDVDLFLFVGPNVTFGLTKTFTAWLGDTEPADPTVDYFGGDNPVNSRLNVFGTFGIGMEYHSLRFQFGYQVGLLDRTTSSNTTEKVNNLFVGVGYAL